MSFTNDANFFKIVLEAVTSVTRVLGKLQHVFIVLNGSHIVQNFRIPPKCLRWSWCFTNNLLVPWWGCILKLGILLLSLKRSLPDLALHLRCNVKEGVVFLFSRAETLIDLFKIRTFSLIPSTFYFQNRPLIFWSDTWGVFALEDDVSFVPLLLEVLGLLDSRDS